MPFNGIAAEKTALSISNFQLRRIYIIEINIFYSKSAVIPDHYFDTGLFTDKKFCVHHAFIDIKTFLFNNVDVHLINIFPCFAITAQKCWRANAKLHVAIPFTFVCLHKKSLIGVVYKSANCPSNFYLEYV